MKRLKQVLKWMKGYKKIYFAAVTLLILLQYFRTITPLFITYIFDNIFGYLQENPPANTEPLPRFLAQFIQGTTTEEKLLYVAIIYILFTLFRVSIMVGRRLVNAYFTENVAYNMKNSLYGKLQDLSFTYHSHAETGDLIQRCTTDVETYRAFIGEQSIEIFRLIFLVSLTIFQMQKLA